MKEGIDSAAKALARVIDRIQDPKILLVIAALIIAAAVAVNFREKGFRIAALFFSAVMLVILLAMWSPQPPPPQPPDLARYISELDAAAIQAGSIVTSLQGIYEQSGSAEVYSRPPPTQNIGLAHTSADLTQKAAKDTKEAVIRLQSDLRNIRSELSQMQALASK